MIRASSVALFVLLAALTGVVVVLGIDAHRLLRHLDGAAARAEAIETKVNATLVNLDKGTAVWAASAKDQAGAVQDLATDAHGTLSEADGAMQGIKGLSQHLQSTADAGTELLGSAQRTTDEIPNTLHHVDDVLGDSRSLLLSGSRTNADLQSVLESHAIERSLENVAGMTDQGNAILGDFRKVADKETADWLKPVPWWKQPIAKAGALIDITAAVARHTP